MAAPTHVPSLFSRAGAASALTLAAVGGTLLGPGSAPAQAAPVPETSQVSTVSPAPGAGGTATAGSGVRPPRGTTAPPGTELPRSGPPAPPGMAPPMVERAAPGMEPPPDRTGPPDAPGRPAGRPAPGTGGPAARPPKADASGTLPRPKTEPPRTAPERPKAPKAEPPRRKPPRREPPKAQAPREEPARPAPRRPRPAKPTKPKAPRHKRTTLAPGIRALAIAASKQGAPYVWGAEGPYQFDCSGLTQYAFRLAGKQLPRTAAQQYHYTRHLPASQRQPGDLVFFGSPGGINHVGIYAGDNKIWHSPRTGARVRLETIWTPNVTYSRVN